MANNIEYLNDYVLNVEHTANYWMVRTMGGDYFDDFVRNGFIAIGYDEIRLNELRGINLEDHVAINQLKGRVAEIYQEAARPGHIVSQLLRFCKKICRGDVVILPGYSSYRLAICRVTGDIYEETNVRGRCPFMKRIPVEVLSITSRLKLSPKAQLMFNSRHPISDIDGYASYIDNMVHDFYTKGEETHLLLKVNTEENVTADQYTCLFDFLKLAEDYCMESGLEGKESDVVVKTQMESPGFVHYISKNKNILAVLGAFILLVNGGGLRCGDFDLSTPGLIKSCSDFMDRNVDRTMREAMKAKLDSLKTDTPEDFQKAVIELYKAQNENRKEY